jgi:hypothetical protein
MKTYYKSLSSKTIVEVKDSSARMGTVVYDPMGEYTIGKEYEFFPFSEKAIWAECFVQDVPYVVKLIDVSNLIQSQKFLDWFSSGEDIRPEDVFTFLKENLDAK